MDKVLTAIKETNKSIPCLINDLQYIKEQITIIEGVLKLFTEEKLQGIRKKNQDQLRHEQKIFGGC